MAVIPQNDDGNIAEDFTVASYDPGSPESVRAVLKATEGMKPKHAGGRPSKYDELTPEEWKSRIDDYLSTCVDKVTPILSEDGDKIVDVTKTVNLPMVEGLGDYLDLDDDTIYAWAKKYKEFSDAIKIIKRKQKLKLANQGLAGNYNSNIAKLILATNHGMSDKQETKLSGGLDLEVEKVDTTNMTIEQLDERLARKLSQRSAK